MLDEATKSLIKRIQSNNDPEAEAQLFSHFGRRIERKIFYSIGENNPDGFDLINDAKIAVLLALRDSSFDIDKDVPLGSYIYGIIKNILKDYFKKGKKIITTSLEAGQNLTGVSHVAEVEHKELSYELKKILKSMDLKFQEIGRAHV